MRKLIYVISLVAFTLSADAVRAKEEPIVFHGRDMAGVVKEEFRRAREELSRDLAKAKATIGALDRRKAQVVAASKKHAAKQKTWIEHLKKFDILLMARYSDKDGNYKPGDKLSKRDQKTLNKILGGYIAETPFVGRTSVQEARETLAVSMEKLDGQVERHADPDVGNSSELRIIAKDRVENVREVNRVQLLAKQLGFNLNSSAGAGKRRPASRKK